MHVLHSMSCRRGRRGEGCNGVLTSMLPFTSFRGLKKWPCFSWVSHQGELPAYLPLQNKIILCAYREGKKAASSQLQVEEAPRFRQTGAQVTGRNLHLWGQVGQAAPHPEQSEATQASLLSGSGILLQDIQVLALLAKLLQKQEHSIPHPCAYTASDTNVLLTGTEVRTCHPDWYPAHFYQSTGRKLTENQMSGDSEG